MTDADGREAVRSSHVSYRKAH